MSDLNKDIAFFMTIKDDLESKHMGKWVLISDQKLIAVEDSFESTASEAVKRFGIGPYLIRQIGAPPMTLPASVIYSPVSYTRS
jgi:hypothetical protein